MAKILVIEDDAIILENTLELLDLEGFTAVGAFDGWLGVQKAEQEMPDVIICDILMPKLDGYGVLKALRANPATQHIPLIFVSAISRDDIRANAAQLGVADYLMKPYQSADLIRAIRRLLTP